MTRLALQEHLVAPTGADSFKGHFEIVQLRHDSAGAVAHWKRGCMLTGYTCRFGAQFQVPMPDRNARKQILQLILENHEREMPGSVDPALLQVNSLHWQIALLQHFSLSGSGDTAHVGLSRLERTSSVAIGISLHLQTGNGAVQGDRSCTEHGGQATVWMIKQPLWRLNMLGRGCRTLQARGACCPCCRRSWTTSAAATCTSSAQRLPPSRCTRRAPACLSERPPLATPAIVRFWPGSPPSALGMTNILLYLSYLL